MTHRRCDDALSLWRVSPEYTNKPPPSIQTNVNIEFGCWRWRQTRTGVIWKSIVFEKKNFLSLIVKGRWPCLKNGPDQPFVLAVAATSQFASKCCDSAAALTRYVRIRAAGTLSELPTRTCSQMAF